MPHRESVAGPWRLKQHRYALAGTKCSECGNMHMPPRRVCECGSENLEVVQFSGEGEIVSYTTIHVAPSGFERKTPYNIALIRLDEGPVVSGVVVGSEGIAVGRRVKSVFRKLYTDGEEGLISYGFKFELVN
jgi:uncharacterized OB-fold protein